MFLIKVVQFLMSHTPKINQIVVSAIFLSIYSHTHIHTSCEIEAPQTLIVIINIFQCFYLKDRVAQVISSDIKGFTRLMLEGKVKQALKLVDKNNGICGVHDLNGDVKRKLEEKHPVAQEKVNEGAAENDERV